MILLFWTLIALMTVLAVIFVLFPLLKNKIISFKGTLVLVLILSSMSIGFYLYWGSSQSLMRYWTLQQQTKIAQQELKKIKNPQQIIDRLAAHLETHPDSAQGWYLLGRLLLTTDQLPKAFSAFSKAYRLQPTNSQYITAYAEAEFMLQQRLSNSTQQALQDIAKKDKKNINVINLLAMNAYFEKKYEIAINYWEQLLPLFDPSSVDGKNLLMMISKAQKQRPLKEE